MVLGRIVERALLVDAPGADWIQYVIERIMRGEPALRLIEATGQKVHAVGGAQRKFVAVGPDEAGALGRVDVDIVHCDGATGGWLRRRRLPGHEIVPGVIADVVCSARLIYAQKPDLSASVAERNANVGTIHGPRPVCDSVSVDLATQDTNGRGIAVVRRCPDGATVCRGTCGAKQPA